MLFLQSRVLLLVESLTLASCPAWDCVDRWESRLPSEERSGLSKDQKDTTVVAAAQTLLLYQLTHSSVAFNPISVGSVALAAAEADLWHNQHRGRAGCSHWGKWASPIISSQALIEGFHPKHHYLCVQPPTDSRPPVRAIVLNWLPALFSSWDWKEIIKDIHHRGGLSFCGNDRKRQGNGKKLWREMKMRGCIRVNVTQGCVSAPQARFCCLVADGLVPRALWLCWLDCSSSSRGVGPGPGKKCTHVRGHPVTA